MKTKLYYVIALSLFLFSVNGIAQIDRTKKPLPGPPPKAAFPEYHETTLSNGLKVLVVTNTAQPVVRFRLMIKSGSEFDGKASGVADFTGDLLTKGTKTRSSLDFAKEADFIGISIGASTADDVMSLYGSGLKKHTEKILELMTDALYNPVFPESELEKARKQTISGLTTAKKDPDQISSRLEITVGYNVHPYSNFQTEEGVKTITRDDLVNFHKTYFIPNNSSLAIIGDVAPNEIIPVVKKYFESWKKGTPPKADFKEPNRVTGKTVHLVDLGSTQTQTSIAVLTTGLKRSNPDYSAFGILNSILGGGFSGRLFANLREKHGFTYGAYSVNDGRKQAGVWNASASVRRIATDSAITEILREMKRMQDEPVSKEELEMHKQYASGRFLLSLENPGTMATRLQDIDLYGLPKDYYKTYVSRIMKVTPEDVRSLAKKYLPTDNIAITAVGDASVIKEGLAQFGTIKMYDPDMNPIDPSAEMKVDIDAETLIARHIKALGGAEKLGAIKNRTIEATVAMTIGPQAMEGDLLEIKKYPNMSYQKTEFSMGAQEMWIDGTSAVQSFGPQTQTLENEDLAEALEDAEFNSLLRYKELGYKPTVTAKKMVDKRPVYVLEIKRKYKTQTLLIDAENFYQFGEDKVEETPMGPMTVETRFSDYKPVDGIMLPYKIKQNSGPVNMELTVKSYKHNTNVSDDVFRKK